MAVLKDKRKIIGMTQSEVGERLGVGRLLVAKWEQRGSVPAKYWKKLSKIYQVDEYTFAKACLYERYGLMTPIAVEMKVRGLFGKDIVDVIGVSGTAVFMWMKGKFYPSIENTIKLAYMFKIDPLDFMRMNIEHKVRVKELKRDECS